LINNVKLFLTLVKYHQKTRFVDNVGKVWTTKNETIVHAWGIDALGSKLFVDNVDNNIIR
jgi:hypothetical protein